jgi:hypothetical protein
VWLSPSVSSWYLMDLWRKYMLVLALCFCYPLFCTRQNNKHMMMPKHDVRNNIEKENLINFRNTRRRQKAEDEENGRTRMTKNRHTENGKKVLNRLIFHHKTFHIFQSSCDGEGGQIVGRGWATRIHPIHPAKKNKKPRKWWQNIEGKWYKIKWRKNDYLHWRTDT